jgi:hypothetical protein
MLAVSAWLALLGFLGLTRFSASRLALARSNHPNWP